MKLKTDIFCLNLPSLDVHIPAICVSLCVLYSGNFLWAPFPWLTDTSCVLYPALSLQIYIKQRGTASVSLHLCCTCHRSICLAACLPASPSHYQVSIKTSSSFHLFLQLSYLIFLSYINLAMPTWALFVCACVCLLSPSNNSAVLSVWEIFSFAFCTVITLILHRSSSLWLSTSQGAAEFDISFNSLSACLSSVLDINIFWLRSRGSLFFSDRKFLAFTSLTCSVCPLPVSPFFFLCPASLLIPWYCRCLWRTGNETLFSLQSVAPAPYHTETLIPRNGCLSLP